MERFEVGIVGAGVHGASAAFHLASRGVRVLVVERWGPAEGPTGRSSAVCRANYSNPFLAEVARDSLAMFRSFGEVTAGRDAGYRETGALFLHPASDEAHVRQAAERLNAIGTPAEVLAAEDLAGRFPMLDLEGVGVGVWEAHAGYADPVGTTTGLFERALELGPRPGCGPRWSGSSHSPTAAWCWSPPTASADAVRPRPGGRGSMEQPGGGHARRRPAAHRRAAHRGRSGHGRGGPAAVRHGRRDLELLLQARRPGPARVRPPGGPARGRPRPVRRGRARRGGGRAGRARRPPHPQARRGRAAAGVGEPVRRQSGLDAGHRRGGRRRVRRRWDERPRVQTRSGPRTARRRPGHRGPDRPPSGRLPPAAVRGGASIDAGYGEARILG